MWKKNPEVTHSALEQIKHLGEITQTWTRYKELAWQLHKYYNG